jgi:hypothetical protein
LELPPLLDAATPAAISAVPANTASVAVTSPITFVSIVSGSSAASAQLLIVDNRAITIILFIANSSLVFDPFD